LDQGPGYRWLRVLAWSVGAALLLGFGDCRLRLSAEPDLRSRLIKRRLQKVREGRAYYEAVYTKKVR
jgi:hypothetical protein